MPPAVALRVPETIKAVRLPVAGKRLRASVKAGAVRVTVPRVQCHAVVVFEY